MVRFGVAVQLHFDDGSERAFQIVGEDEADPTIGLISWVSPVGSTLIGHRVGDSMQIGGRSAKIIGMSAHAPN